MTAPANDDVIDLDGIVSELGLRACASAEDPLRALLALATAGAAVCLTQIHPSIALSCFDGAVANARKQLEGVLTTKGRA